MPPPPVEVSDEERVERLAFVESLYLAGMPTQRIVTLCMRPFGRDVGGNLTGLGLGNRAVRELVTQVRTAYLDDFKAREATRRTDQLARLHNDLARMRSSGKVPWSTVATTEKLVAEVEGNLAPRRFEVGVQALPDALTQALASQFSTDEAVQLALAEERERERRLRAIETTGEASPGA